MHWAMSMDHGGRWDGVRGAWVVKVGQAAGSGVRGWWG